jgi:hypothetical protein
VQARVDDFHAGVTQRSRDDFRAAVMPVQAGLPNEDANFAFSHLV